MEQKIMDIDELLIVKPTSFTTSKRDQVQRKDVGRPKTDNPTDDTERINDSN